MDSPLIFAKSLDKQGGSRAYSDLAEVDSASPPLWLHFNAKHELARAAIQKTVNHIDEHSLQAMFDEDARPRALQLDAGTLMIFRGINHNKDNSPEDMIAVRLWVTEDCLVSLQYRKSRALQDVAKSLDQQRGPKSIGDIVASITAALFDYIESTIYGLEDKMDDLESRVIDKPNKQLRADIANIRKSAILLRRHVAPQKETINQLHYSDLAWLDKKNQRHMHEAQDTLLRCVETLDTVRERSQVVKDELVNTLSDKLNRNLYVISVITAIFLPLSFLTGLFGINIGGMPGVDNTLAFTLFCGALAVIVALQIILFKYFKWF